jgi:hypothetical protein
MQAFTKLFQKRNFSYSQVLNYYQQTTFDDQGSIDKASYRRQFFKFKERRQNVPFPSQIETCSGEQHRQTAQAPDRTRHEHLHSASRPQVQQHQFVYSDGSA